jgi:hypothetical protein
MTIFKLKQAHIFSSGPPKNDPFFSKRMEAGLKYFLKMFPLGDQQANIIYAIKFTTYRL